MSAEQTEAAGDWRDEASTAPDDADTVGHDSEGIRFPFVLGPTESRAASGSAGFGTRFGERFTGRLSAGLAWGVLFVLGGMWLLTWSEQSRRPAPQEALAWAGPDLHCWSGYDRLGRCTLANLSGGVHSFLGPGLLAVGVTVLGGVLLGLMVSYDRSPFRALARAILSGMDGLPRLGVFMLVFSLSDHSPLALGMAVGTLGIPSLAVEIRERMERLQQSSFIQASRAHGLKESRIVGLHLLWLACQERILRQGVLTFAALLIAESSLSFALQVNASPTEESWGHLLYVSTEGLNELLSLAMETSDPELWRKVFTGLLPFFWVAGALLGVLWASWHLGDRLAQRREMER